MQKHITALLNILNGLIIDVEDIHGLPRGTFQSDFEKVTVSVRSRGISVLLLDFPSLCGALESALDSGDALPLLGKPFVKKGKPTIFGELFSKIFSEKGTLLDEPCVESIRSLRQIFRFAKKFRIDAPKDAVTEKYREFASIEEQLIPPVLSWGDDDLRIRSGFPTLIRMGSIYYKTTGGLDQCERSGDESRVFQTLDTIQSIFDRFARTFKYKAEWFKPKHGPGAVSEQFGKSKFEFPTWPFRLESQYPFDLYGLVNHQIWDGPAPLDHSEPCRLIGVPKDFKGPRLIASEPICSQFVQQGIMNVLRENVKRSPLRHCIDFRSQEPSRLLVLSASEDKSYSTIDLSSASDRLSCAVVECAFRRNFSFMEILNAARTPDVLFPDGQTLRMKKFAAQGAAFTFPVQTIIYALICMGVISYHTGIDNMNALARKVRVYGDDMVVPSDVFPFVCEILEVLQLRVNLGKSFNQGFFRESCGMDAYLGQDITPASVLTTFSERAPESLVSTVECSNNLFMRGYINASRVLLETIPKRYLENIACKSSGSTVFGILTGGVNRSQRIRWNKYLHRLEQKVLTVESKVKKSSPDGHSRLAQWFIENPAPHVKWESGEVESVKARYCLRWVPLSMIRAGGA